MDQTFILFKLLREKIALEVFTGKSEATHPNAERKPSRIFSLVPGRDYHAPGTGRVPPVPWESFRDIAMK